KYKKKAIADLLKAYRDGLDTASALKTACAGVSKADFEKGYRAFLEKKVKELGGRKPEKRRTFDQLKEEYEKDKKNADVAAALAEMYLSRDRGKARELAEAAQEIKKTQPRAALVLARLARLGGDAKKERAILEAARDKDEPDAKLLLALGK